MKRKIYEQIKGTGEVRNLPISLFPKQVGGQEYGGELSICPYTNYIPLSYLFTSEEWRISVQGDTYMEQRGVKITHRRRNLFKGGMRGFADTAFSDSYSSTSSKEIGVDILKRMMECVNEYLFFDEPICPTKQTDPSSLYYTPRRETIIREISRKSCIFSQRSYHGYISPYSLYRMERYPIYTPHVLAVVRPEHYMWLKLNFLLTGNIDMSKVVILIDNQLDTTLFPHARFKSLYKSIKPEILKTSAQIWRVPQEFIQENCFLPKFELKEKNIVKRKEEINRLIEEFYESERRNPSFTEQSILWATDVLSTETIGLWEQMRNTPPITNYITDSLQYSTYNYTIQTGQDGMEALQEAFIEAREGTDGPGGDGFDVLYEEEENIDFSVNTEERITEEIRDDGLPELLF